MTRRNVKTAHRLGQKRGATLLGYGLVIGLIAVVALGSVESGGQAVNNLMGDVASTMQDAVDGTAGTGSGEEPEASPTSTPLTFAVWGNPSFSISGDGDMTLSNGDRTVHRTGDPDGSDSWARSNSDRYLEGDRGYFEINIDQLPGFTPEYSTHRIEVGVLVGGSVQIIWNGERGYYWQATTNNVDPNHYYSAGDVIGIAVDRPAGKIWFTRDGSNWNHSGGNPVTGDLGANPAVFSFTPDASIRARTLMMARDNVNTGDGPQVTINAGQEPFVHGAPSGFDACLTSPTP